MCEQDFILLNLVFEMFWGKKLVFGQMILVKKKFDFEKTENDRIFLFGSVQNIIHFYNIVNLDFPSD